MSDNLINIFVEQLCAKRRKEDIKSNSYLATCFRFAFLVFLANSLSTSSSSVRLKQTEFKLDCKSAAAWKRLQQWTLKQTKFFYLHDRRKKWFKSRASVYLKTTEKTPTKINIFVSAKAIFRIKNTHLHLFSRDIVYDAINKNRIFKIEYRQTTHR